MEATMHEAKTNLSKLVARARAGEEVIITNGKTRVAIARIEPIHPDGRVSNGKPAKRPLGIYAGQISIGPEFFEPLPEDELALWEGSAPSSSSDVSAKNGEGE